MNAEKIIHPVQHPLVSALRLVHPEIAVSIVWEYDHDYVWDGLPKDKPKSNAYQACVKVVKIVGGEFVEGTDYLGGCYPIEDNFDNEIGGYFPQMLEVALRELDASYNLPTL
jgi:hypothetical protein